jgi:hypothetical protein
VGDIRFRLLLGLLISYVAGIFLAILVQGVANCLFEGLARCVMSTSGSVPRLSDRVSGVLMVSAIALVLSFPLLLLSAAIAMIFSRNIVTRPAAWCIAASMIVPLAYLVLDYATHPNPKGFAALLLSYDTPPVLLFLFCISGTCALLFFVWLRLFVRPALLPNSSQG